MKTENSGIVNFILDESYQRFVIKSTPGDAKFWESWISKNPDALQAFNESQEIISFITARKVLPTNNSISDEVFSTLLLKIENDTEPTKRLTMKKRFPFYFYTFTAILMAGMAFYYVFNSNIT